MSYQVINNYDFDQTLKERYKRTDYHIADKPSFGDSHGYSYLHLRNEYQTLGEIMGFDLEEPAKQFMGIEKIVGETNGKHKRNNG